MIIHGPKSINKIEIIVKAVWYAKEHEEIFETVRDGVYSIDLSSTDDMEEVYEAITDLDLMSEVTAKRRKIIQSSVLQNSKIVFVFEGLNTKPVQF